MKTSDSFNISSVFIGKPVATTLLTVALALAGAVAYTQLPVSPLPQTDSPTINVGASLPGASPETMASSVATPLERQFGRIAAVTEMTSASTLGSTSISLQFDLNRDINAAARDVEAAINAARGYLPANLPSNPRYYKVNPSDSPIFQIALTSKVLDKSQMYDAASTIMAQKISQIRGVGQVNVQGSALPGVRVELNPMALNKYGISLEDVRSVLVAQNANTPKGHFADQYHTWEVGANDQMFRAKDYRPVLIAYRNGRAVRLSDVAEVVDGPEDLRNVGYVNGKPGVLITINRQPGANIIDTVDHIRAVLPQLRAAIPQTIDIDISQDQTVTIRASVREVEKTLSISIALVILVVFVFLRSVRSTFIPSVSVPVSLIATFGVMYLLGYSVDNLSLMALTIATGFVVDDAIVVIENISRYLEQGMAPLAAALRGAQEIGFTVVTMSVSLVAVFIPLLMMGGIVGRLFREFSVVLAVSIVVSMFVSLTTTPMMCAHLLRNHVQHGWVYRTTERGFNWTVRMYGRTIDTVLLHPTTTLLVLAATIGLNVYLYITVPKGFFPQQDNGRMIGSLRADQDSSFQTMQQNLLQMLSIVQADPAVAYVSGNTGGSGGGGRTINNASVNIQLKPLSERKVSIYQVIERLRPKLATIRGSTLFLVAIQDVKVGARSSAALYQFTMRCDNVNDLQIYGQPMLAALQHVPEITDVNSDQQNQGLQSVVTYDRDTAARFGISSQLIDNTLYDAFGQRQASIMYTTLNQYHVIMEVAPQYWQNPEFLNQIWVESPDTGTQVPLSAFAHFAPDTAPLAIAHQGLFPAVTISFNLAPNVALGDAVAAIEEAASKVGLPPSIQTVFAGTAQAFQQSP